MRTSLQLAASALAVTLPVLALRHWLALRPSARRYVEPFAGRVFAVGKCAVAERRSPGARSTVVAMHGFVEDMRYFTEHYAGDDIQLLLVTSCDYHVPFGEPPHPAAPWAEEPTGAEGSIRYDAQALVQVLEHMPTTDRVRVHGHSRGGAVVLEAASIRPDLFERVEVVLEAPVLPQGKPYAPMSPVMAWLFPLLGVPLWKWRPINAQNRGAFGSLANARKRHLIEGLPFHPKRAELMLANLRDIATWMSSSDARLFDNVRGVVLLAARDRVLDTEAMRASAARAVGRLELVEVADSHFILFDHPEAFPPLP